jgi:hypothetical protein
MQALLPPGFPTKGIHLVTTAANDRVYDQGDLVSGQQYTYTAYVYGVSGTSRVRLYVSDGTTNHLGPVTNLVPGQLDRISITFTSTGAGGITTFRLYDIDGGSDFWATGFLCEEGAMARPYFDGDGHVDDAGNWIEDDASSWTGADHASASDYGVGADNSQRTHVIVAEREDDSDDHTLFSVGELQVAAAKASNDLLIRRAVEDWQAGVREIVERDANRRALHCFVPDGAGGATDPWGGATATPVGGPTDAELLGHPALDYSGSGQYLSADAGTRRNLHPWPNFENGIGAWQGVGSNTIAEETSIVPTGFTKSMKVTWQGTNWGAWTAGSFTLPDASDVWLSGMVYVPADWDGASLVINDGGTLVGSSVLDNTQGSTAGVKGSWVLIKQKIRPDAGDLTGRIRVQVGTPLPTNGKFAFYGPTMISTWEPTSLSDFFTPAQFASGEAGWLGTAHDSASDLGVFANGTVRTFLTPVRLDALGATRVILGAGGAQGGYLHSSGSISFSADAAEFDLSATSVAVDETALRRLTPMLTRLSG